MLEAGEALITYPGAPFAIPAKIYWYDDYIDNMEKSRRDGIKMDDGFY